MTNKSDFTRARVGDKVWSPFGPECAEGGTNGEIRKVYPEGVSTVFNNDSVYFFTLKGIYHRNIDSFPTLFHARPTIEIPPPPKRMKWVEVEVRPWRDVHGRIILLSSDETRYLNCGPAQTIEVEVYDD